MITPSFHILKQCDQVILENYSMPYIKSYYSCLNRVIDDGYSEDFQFSARGILAKESKKEYRKGEFKVTNMFRFEGSGNSNDYLSMYILETSDGLKGTLVASELEERKQILF